MVSWIIPLVYIMEKNANDNDLTDHSINPHREKNADSNDLTYPLDTASIFYLFIVLQKILISTLFVHCLKILFGNLAEFF